uniref:TDP43_N domain-containing protein n=1 Tax=Heterorhabditis bacteriophora TaxID=37862 RepID=A0A1I7XV82_HETBA
MTTNVISSPSNKRWVKLQLEPVEVPVDYDDKLLFSTVQSVVPGAHGLYYRENGKRKALNFDTITGCVQAPDAGWDTKDIYIYLAHGNKHATHYSDYTKASQEFGKNISAVQKLMAAAGFSFEPKLPYAEKPSRTRSRSRGIKSGFEAQPENVHFSEESDGNSVHQLIEQKNKEIEKLLEGNIELKLKLKELKRDLKEQVRTNAELRRVISKSEDEKESSIRNFVQSPTVMSTEVLNEKSFKEREELEELQKILIEYKNNIENSKIIMKGKDEEINKNEKEIAKLRLDLEQTNLALIEQKKRVNNLEEEEASNLKFINNDSTTSEDIEVISTMDSRNNMVDSRIPELEDKLKKTEHEKTGYIEEEKRMDFIKLKDEQINHLTASLKETQKTLEESKNKIYEYNDLVQRLNWEKEHLINSIEDKSNFSKIQELIEKEEEINNLHSVIADLRSTIAKIKKEKEESEWHLGEHKEWLKNSKEKVLYLENQVNILNGGEPVMEKNSLPVSSIHFLLMNCGTFYFHALLGKALKHREEKSPVNLRPRGLPNLPSKPLETY